MAARAIRRFFRSFTIDLFRLRFVAAGRDPYKTAMTYGYACSAVEALPELAAPVIRVARRDVALAADFTAEKPEIDMRVVLTVQLYKLVHMAAAFAAEYLRYRIKARRERSAAASERTDENGRQQDQ